MDEAIRILRDRARLHPPDRYPVQHATARFHLGVTLLHGGHATAAAQELESAAGLFRSSGMHVEHAKATLMLGVALREDGSLGPAEDAFRTAASAFAVHGQPSEHAAALQNLGMVARDRADLVQAEGHFAEAVEAFDALGELAARTSADRELGATRLSLGRPEDAMAPLRRAMEEAGGRGDPVAWGAAANALGLAHLACGDLVAAEDAFRGAVSANPRSVRPEGYAMAKANLALLYEEAGSPARAGLAAHQARGVPVAPAAVVVQAAGVLRRLGEHSGLVAVLDEEPEIGWPSVLRDELARWADADELERLSAARAWIDGVLLRRERAAKLLFAWLDAVLELPPTAMDRVLAVTVRAWAEHDKAQRDDFRSLTSRVLPRFHIPQWQRLHATFERLATAAGEPVTWR
ncbi:hypothetical protein BH23CHL8_BH23CHL8_31550 [soil metagenome]